MKSCSLASGVTLAALTASVAGRNWPSESNRAARSGGAVMRSPCNEPDWVWVRTLFGYCVKGQPTRLTSMVLLWALKASHTAFHASLRPGSKPIHETTLTLVLPSAVLAARYAPHARQDGGRDELAA